MHHQVFAYSDKYRIVLWEREGGEGGQVTFGVKKVIGRNIVPW